MKIDVVVPSNNALSMARFLLSDESIAEIGAMGGAVCLCAQFGYDDLRLVKSITDRAGIELRINQQPQSERPSMTRLRSAAWKLSTAPISLHLDDNIELLPGAADFFLKLVPSGAGLVLCGHVFGSAAAGKNLRAFRGKVPSMAGGMLWLSKMPPYRAEQTHLLGGCEEYLMAANANSYGEWIGKQFYTPTQHHGRKTKVTPGDPSFIHDLSIAKRNCLKVAAEIMGAKSYKSIRWNKNVAIPSQFTAPIERSEKWKESYKNRGALGKVWIDGVEYPSLTEGLAAHGFDFGDGILGAGGKSMSVLKNLRLKLRKEKSIAFEGRVITIRKDFTFGMK